MDRTGWDFLVANAEVIKNIEEPELNHLRARMTLRQYLRIANEVARIAPGPKLLDWGCGYGQMSYLLAQRGLEVTSFDYGIEPGRASLDDRVPVAREIAPIISEDPVQLPFDQERFSTVLSCGVLEHVENESGSLAEIRRVLEPGGVLAIYNLPQERSYKEAVIKRFHLGYFHERTYSPRSIVSILQSAGFAVMRIRRAGFLPHMLTGLPSPLRSLYNLATPVFYPADRLLSRTPGLRGFAEALEVMARVAR